LINEKPVVFKYNTYDIENVKPNFLFLRQIQ